MWRLLWAAAATTVLGVNLHQKLDLRRPTALRRDLKIEHLRGDALVGIPRSCAASVSDSLLSSDSASVEILHTLRVTMDPQGEATLRSEKIFQPYGQSTEKVLSDICVDVVAVKDADMRSPVTIGPIYYGKAMLPERAVATHSAVPRLHHLFCSAVFVGLSSPAEWSLTTAVKVASVKAMPEWPPHQAMSLVHQGEAVFEPASDNDISINVPIAALTTNSGELNLSVEDARELFSRCHPLTLRSQDSLPVLKNLHREIYFPNWGDMVQMTESYELENLAPTLWDEYHPSDISMLMHRTIGTKRQHDRDLRGMLTLFEVTSHLPQGVQNFEYYDAIGNISTSYVTRNAAGGYDIALEPRYPLMGGWQATFTVRYSVPLHSEGMHQRLTSGAETFSVSLTPSVWPLWSEKQTLDLILPPKSRIVTLETGARRTAESVSTIKRWLDLLTERLRVRLEFGPLRLASPFSSASPSVTVTFERRQWLAQAVQVLSLILLVGFIAVIMSGGLLIPQGVRLRFGAKANVPDVSRALMLLGDIFLCRKMGCGGETKLASEVLSLVKGYNETGVERELTALAGASSAAGVKAAETKLIRELVSKKTA